MHTNSMNKPKVSFLFLILLGFFFSNSRAETDTIRIRIADTLHYSEVISLDTELAELSLKNLPPDDELKKKKLVSALFAFPFPFGFMGAHRVMLGCKPWVPVVYVATFGGCFGLLPLIDFCVIVFSKDIEQFENNSQVFMWVK
ncbi:MAG: TM2 domain-containing protein [Bacteroidota bacterium]|nr:TM2 domain-containing protein [Bacteroidota bacterium]